jgi:hypothetical protein
MLRELGNALLTADGPPDDVTPRGIAQRGKDAIEVGCAGLH